MCLCVCEKEREKDSSYIQLERLTLNGMELSEDKDR